MSLRGKPATALTRPSSIGNAVADRIRQDRTRRLDTVGAWFGTEVVMDYELGYSSWIGLELPKPVRELGRCMSAPVGDLAENMLEQEASAVRTMFRVAGACRSLSHIAILVNVLQGPEAAGQTMGGCQRQSAAAKPNDKEELR